ncbi:MAG: alanine--tRNA ligase [Rhizobiales bacterium]|nr:alanine--tRNA ligase [Hyphomicrobiales bacterium]NRB13809.1 alanine--tRNA ligase [Hyphomicrobiales bacterium]
MSTVNEIRSKFLDYFEKKDHKIMSSGSLVPLNDPTLMFANAGMNQFKNIFTGVEKPDFPRATTSQKCVRAGGKHNDLDNVGYTARHHTFFEMLGNFSFGDYFKEDAIAMAWELLTKEYGINADKLLVTVYHTDDEAANIWKKVAGISDDKIIRIATSDNFWTMGATGPCGPCSEIFYDHGDHIWGGPPGSKDEDGDRFIEIWNLVFMQHENLADGTRIDLPKPSIDTGMGLERLSALLQGSHDNYETDTMRALIGASAEFSGVDADGSHNISHRVIADHLRSVSFLIADGVLPSNEGRGYVLRRIMRRAMRHIEMLGVKDPMMYKLLPSLITQMGQAFPELVRAKALISETMKLEESRFKKTLDKGLKILDDETSSLAEGGELDGKVAFKLYDTYGFPYDLTVDALRERKMTVDKAGFDEAMEEQRTKARASWSGAGGAAEETIWFEHKEKLGATEFLGYSSEKAEGVVEVVQTNAETGLLEIVLNQTPFYAESGGQVGDHGIIKHDNVEIKIINVLKKAGTLFVHYGQIISGELAVGDAVILEVNGERRRAIRANHSATHLLHQALRDKLGDHVAQKGSMVSDERLRFDFSHTKPVSDEELASVEKVVNSYIIANSEVVTRVMDQEDAVKSGAMALFGEKYGDEVRVVSMGLTGKNQNAYSVELCGGTHVQQTGDIGLLKIVSETSVASGVRRIEALTAENAMSYLNVQDRRVKNTAEILKTSPEQLAERVAQLVVERKQLDKELADAKRQIALGGGGSAQIALETINGVNFEGRVIEGIAAKELRGIVDEAKTKHGSAIVAIIGISDEGKAGISVGVTADLIDKFNAVDLVRIGSTLLGGKGGGGRPDMAQAGGPDGTKGDEAISAIRAAISN